MKSHNYNAHHSPIGTFASFTLGFRGAQGGLGLELGGPANQNMFVGFESAPGQFELLPFFEADAGGEESLRYDAEGNEEFDGPVCSPYVGVSEEGGPLRPVTLRSLGEREISRHFTLGSDTWKASHFSFTIFSPVRSVPDPDIATEAQLKPAIAPVVLCELSIDHTQGEVAGRAVFGFTGNDLYSGMRRLDDTSNGEFVGVGQGRHLAVVSKDEGVTSALGFKLEDILCEQLPENHAFSIGNCGALICDVPAGAKRTFRFAVCFHRDGLVTAGLDMRYLYTRFFPCIESVASYALEHFETLKSDMQEADSLTSNSKLSQDQHWMLCHSVRSYYGSSQLLEYEGQPVWVVNEGEYRMMNTFDLTVDHLFWELRQNPWAVRNQLDWFVDRYSYEDKLRFPGDSAEYPGGLSFTHDMGALNIWSRPGYSSYEKQGLHGCFSYMTYEQLVNWLCCATTYVQHTGDNVWLEERWPIFEKCFQSLLNRDHPDPAHRRGLMQLDSTRCAGGSEITTYDSLDVSLGQARNNIYLASKTWASYLGMEKLFRARCDEERASLAHSQAVRTMQTLLENVTEEGTMPAVLEGGNDSKIIPVIEGLIFPFMGGCRSALATDAEFSPLISALKRHLEAVLVPGKCLFEDGGWKLSSTSDNSWLSKIYLCQFIAREILGLSQDDRDVRADAAHVNWLLDERNAYFAWSDQMMAGVAVGSKYYPRGVTSTLWLLEGNA